MFYDPRSQAHGLPHNPWNALVSPRPIGWISTISAAGIANLAPYSFFNAVSGSPPFVMFSSTPRKNSQSNVEALGEFVVNVATWDLREKMNASSAPYPSDIDEFEAVGLEKAACRNVRAPRVARSPVAIECHYYKTVPLEAQDGTRSVSSVILGEVVGIHIDKSVMTAGLVDARKLLPLARLGYMDYSVTRDVFPMARPVLDQTGVQR